MGCWLQGVFCVVICEGIITLFNLLVMQGAASQISRVTRLPSPCCCYSVVYIYIFFDMYMLQYGLGSVVFDNVRQLMKQPTKHLEPCFHVRHVLT